MNKTLILSLALALGITTVCAASPLKNYTAGKVAVDLGLTVPTSNTYEGHSVGSKKTSPYAGITVGLGSNTAINYKWNQYKNSGSNNGVRLFVGALDGRSAIAVIGESVQGSSPAWC